VSGWEDVDNRWPDRLVTIARLIPPGNAVLDLGAGAQGLKPVLQRRCTYTPADLHRRTPDTLAFDMNAGVWPKGHWNVAVMAGVLEYADDPRAVLGKVRQHATWAVLSYRHKRSRGDIKAALFANELSVTTFKQIAHQAGWRKVLNMGDWRSEAGGKHRIWKLL
jgi:hypothetical protein